MVVIDENDLGKTKIQILMDLIFESTGMRIPEHQISYGYPEELDARPEVLDDPNTYIPIKVKVEYDAPLSGGGGFMYRRLLFKDFFDGNSVTLPITAFPIRISQIVETFINPTLSYPLNTGDYLDYELTDPNATRLELKAHPHSPLFMGSITFPSLPLDPSYFDLVANPFLPGFTVYAPPP